MKKLIWVGIFTALILAGCGASEGEIQTAIAETEAAKPTETITPHPTLTSTEPIYHVELQIKSKLVNSMESHVWTFEWGINGNLSTYKYDWSELSEHNFSAGYHVHWSQDFNASSGDEIMLSVSGKHEADCVILIDGAEVVTSKLAQQSYFDSSPPSKAVCNYQIP